MAAYPSRGDNLCEPPRTRLSDAQTLFWSSASPRRLPADTRAKTTESDAYGPCPLTDSDHQRNSIASANGLLRRAFTRAAVCRPHQPRRLARDV